MDIRRIVTSGLGILAGVLATEAAAEQRVPSNEDVRVEMVSYDPAEESDSIRRSATVQRIEILERYEEHELKRLSLLDQMQRLQERSPEYLVRTISSIQSEKEMFVNSTSRYSVHQLSEKLAKINIDLDALNRAEDQISLDTGRYLLALTLDTRDQRPRRAKKVEANEGAFLEYQRMFDENERLVELTERRTQEAIADIETRDNTTFEQMFAQYGENWQELLPTNIRIQTAALEDRREALRSRFIEYFGEAPEDVIGARNVSSHYIHPQKISEFLAELIRTDVHDNHERVLTSIGNERYRDQLEARAREDTLIARLVEQEGVIFLDDQQKLDYQTQIDSATRNDKIRFIGMVGDLWGYGLERVTDQEAREIAVARGIAPVLPEEKIAENTTRNKGVTPQNNSLTVQDQETTVTIYDTHLTEQQILELIQGFEGKVYGAHTIKAEDLELTLWNTFAAVGVLHDVDAMGKRSNENLRYEILNHGDNPQVLGSSYGKHGDNSTKNTKALRNLLAGKIDLNLTEDQIYESMQRLSQLQNPNEIEKIAMLLLSREVNSRNLEQTLAESLRERENALTLTSLPDYSLDTNSILSLTPDQIDYNERMGNLLSQYSTRGAGSIDQVVEAVNYARSRGEVVSRFNKEALKSSGDIGMAYNIIADQELTYDQRIAALESSIGMSASKSTIGRLRGEAESYVQAAAEEEAEETLAPNERVSITQLAQIVEEKAENATRATPTTYSSLGKRAA
ncbi:hypothetical protein HOD38_05500 [archaeon]|jgi:hypothetical protein|nr:hypothetical protein [archaeon]MBT4397696.1 hypothetical protein [archaeon]MBT4441608.1 hypothetical protein [archaeon]